MAPRVAGDTKKKEAKSVAVGTKSKSNKAKVVTISLSSKSKKSERSGASSKPAKSSKSPISTKTATPRKDAVKKASSKTIPTSPERTVEPKLAISKLSLVKKKVAIVDKLVRKFDPTSEVDSASIMDDSATDQENLEAHTVDDIIPLVEKAPCPKKPLALTRNSAKADGAKKSKGRFLATPFKKGKRYNIDLRIHSPGTIGFFSTGGVEPGAAFLRLAKVKGLEIMAVTDHNNAEFIDVIKSYAHNSPVTVIPGVDLCCRIALCNEVYLIALFPETFTSADVFQVLEKLGVPSSARGKHDFVIELPFSEVVRIVEEHQGVLIPTRLDKTPFRQLALPTIVEEYGMHVFDIIHPDNTDFFEQRWPDGEFTFFCFSNANSLAQVGSRLEKVRLMKPGFEGIKELVKRRAPK